MKNEHIFLFLDNPETLESVTFSLHKWYSPLDGPLQPSDSTLRVTHGCSISPVFDRVIVDKRYRDWDTGQAELNKVYQEWTDKGFKTRKELGIVDKDENLTHDQLVNFIRRQLAGLYLRNKEARAYVPAWLDAGIENFHIFTVRYIPAGETTPSRVNIHSELHGTKQIISLTEKDAITTAAKYLKQNGFELIGEGEGQLDNKNIKTMYIISDTFKALK